MLYLILLADSLSNRIGTTSPHSHRKKNMEKLLCKKVKSKKQFSFITFMVIFSLTLFRSCTLPSFLSHTVAIISFLLSFYLSFLLPSVLACMTIIKQIALSEREEENDPTTTIYRHCPTQTPKNIFPFSLSLILSVN